jgi:N-ethylmaleimide reductase
MLTYEFFQDDKMSKDLFDPIILGDVTIKNRILMCPLTRMRAKQPGNVPWELNATYYAQRASAGLIISEASQISQQAQGYPNTPGIYTQEQIAGWQKVTQAVHENHGKMFLQLWHVGRISHPSHQPNGDLPVAPSAIAAANSGTFTKDGTPTPILTPRALETYEIPVIVNDYAHAASCAKAANFDGVEVHGANGYLLDQFLQDNSNKRTDEYGGSVANRCKLLLNVVDAVANIWGYGRIGVRLSPFGTFNDMQDSNPIALFSYLLHELSNRKIAYVHVVEPRSSGSGGREVNNLEAPNICALLRAEYGGNWISAGGYEPLTAKEAVSSGAADAIAFGRWFISNPDLPARIKNNCPLNPYDRSTFYGGGEHGYTDYPYYSEHAK